MNDTLNKSLIEKHEGLRTVAYKDTRGILTIGYGFNLETSAAPIICSKLGIDYAAIRSGAAITQGQADTLFTYAYGLVVADIIALFPNFQSYPENVVAVLCDMRYQLGYAGFRAFEHFIAAVRSENWSAAIAEMEDSLWAKQVPERCAENVKLMETA